MAHMLLSRPRHARAVQRALLIQMLIRLHRAPTAARGSTRHSLHQLALTVLLAKPTWTPILRHLVPRALQDRTRQLLRSSALRVLLVLRT